MKSLGSLLIIVGLVWGIIAFNIDTSVEVGGQSYGSGEYSFDIPKVKVNNIGLMNEKQNHIFGAGITLILGVILFVFGSKEEDKEEKDKQEKVVETLIQEDELRFKVSFCAKNEDSWQNIKIKLLDFYMPYGVDKIISDKETSWMISAKEEGVKGYVKATLDGNTIIIESFKLLKPDMSIIDSETKQELYENEAVSVKDISSTDKLIELGKLFEQQLITKEEFESEKKKILVS